MSELLAAAKEIYDWLDSQRFRACIIGGLAVQRWGEPRLTRDVDLTVMAEIGNEEPIVDACLARFSPRTQDARDFALQHRVVLVRSSNGVDLDLGLVRHWLNILAEIKNDPNLGRAFEEALASASVAANRKEPR